MTLLRRHGLWLVVAALVGIMGALLFYAGRAHVYLSTAQVDVEPNPTIVGTPVTPNMATEQQVATSGVVVGRAATALGIPPLSLTGHLSAKANGTADVLSISCTMTTPIAAQNCAAAAATAYVGFRNLPDATTVEQAHDPLRVTIVTQANLPHSIAGPGKKILLPIGAVLGLALGAGAIVLRDRFDGRVRDRDDLERFLRAPVLTAVPRVRRREGGSAAVFHHAPRSKAAESYRYLRSRLRPFLSLTWGGGTVLLVAGPKGREGRTSVAANMARALAQGGASVLLVDADLRSTRPGRAHPSLSEMFGATAWAGLSELLAGKAALNEVVRPVDQAGLRLVAAGAAAGDGADLFAAADLAEVFSTMKAIADVVIVDSAPVLSVSDAVCLARACDLVLLVADARHTDRGAVSAAAHEIRGAGATLVGVLNGESAWAVRRAPAVTEPEWLGPAPQPGIIPPHRPNGQHATPLGPTRPYGMAAADEPTLVYGVPSAPAEPPEPAA